jgi:sulfhydrogenase subunit gamma (sulfur reductase)
MPVDQMTNIPSPAEIVALRPISGDTTLFRLRLTDEEAARGFTFVPGQFVQVSAPAAGEAPFSPVNPPRNDGTLELCVRSVGHVTSQLHKARQGEMVGVRGPFGMGFPVAEMTGKDILLLAGGLGIVPLYSLLCHLLEHRDAYASITLMYGAREPSALLLREELRDLACRRDMRLMLTVDFAAEEGACEPSCAVGLLPDLLRGSPIVADNSYAAVCGPPALYRCIIGELQGLGFSDQHILLSLERRMKCGLGRCAHCAVGQLLCCIDGPVFRYSDLKTIEGAL